MCLGIVGQVIALDAGHPDLAEVVRKVNIGILQGEALKPGDWILIHAGFAMERIDEETATNQLAALREYTGDAPEGGELDFD